MALEEAVRILLVEDNAEFANAMRTLLEQYTPTRFDVTWRDSGDRILDDVAEGAFDLILMDYFLPGRNGLELTRLLHEHGVGIPVVFLTVNKDFELAVEVLQLGVADYVLKEEVASSNCPRMLLDTVERHRMEKKLTALEISTQRLEAIRDLVLRITEQVQEPMDELVPVIDQLMEIHGADQLSMYVKIIRDNHLRITQKMKKLKDLKTDKTIQYIKDIRMFDIS
ncbi:MAG: response regulator [Ignavibacteria bacterium]|nr:response regulator [Ignavibacteria bacterium]